MPEISISDPHSAETVAAPRPHPHVVHRKATSSSPPANRPASPSSPPVPRGEWDDEPRTILRPSNRMAAVEDPTTKQRPSNRMAAVEDPTTKRPTAPRPAEPAPIDNVLADLDARSTVGPKHAESAVSAALTGVTPSTRRRRVLLAIMVVLAAAGTAAVVYFALPYLT
jgi:hypothetical protein